MIRFVAYAKIQFTYADLRTFTRLLQCRSI